MHTPWSHTSNVHTYMAGGQGQGDRTPADRCFRHWNGITTTYFATICGPCQILLDEGKVDRRLEQHSFQGTRCERPADAVAIEPVAIVPATTDRESLSPQQPALDNVEAGRRDAFECSLRMLVADWDVCTCPGYVLDVALRQVKRKGGILRHAAGRELGQVVLEWCTSHARSMSRVGGGVLCDVVWCVTSISSCLQL